VIELEMLEAMFDNIAAGPKWDMKGPMLWGYFFTDASAQKLEIVAEVLLETGYRLVELFEAEVEQDDEPTFVLHVERVEIHSPQSLHERNAQLYELAERHGLRSYDGMDVGPAAPNE
jgi:hypothetical protein